MITHNLTITYRINFFKCVNILCVTFVANYASHTNKQRHAFHLPIPRHTWSTLSLLSHTIYIRVVGHLFLRRWWRRSIQIMSGSSAPPCIVLKKFKFLFRCFFKNFSEYCISYYFNSKPLYLGHFKIVNSFIVSSIPSPFPPIPTKWVIFLCDATINRRNENKNSIWTFFFKSQVNKTYFDFLIILFVVL